MCCYCQVHGEFWLDYLFTMMLFLQIFEGESVKTLSQSDTQQSKITSIRFTCDGQKVAIGLDDGGVQVSHGQ